MSLPPKKILSASRRTDIPAFYLEWFSSQMEKGWFDIQNPYTKKKRRVEVCPQNIDTIVFWSKNFGPFLQQKTGEKLLKQGYHLYFNFTINSEIPVLEPGVPGLETRLSQIQALSERFGASSIAWRFDPICFYRTGEKQSVASNLTHFSYIARKVSGLGIQKCVTSFFDPYAKIKKRIKKLYQSGKQFIEFTDPPLHQKTALIRNMAKNVSGLGIKLDLCCEKEVFNALAGENIVRQNACIDGRMFQQRAKETIVTRRDYGQRAQKGCQCTQSIDIGSYDLHPCQHNCIFCYANPIMDTRH